MLRERLGKELLFLDGGMGTLLQERGLDLGRELPETWNITHKEDLIEIHKQYIEAGSQIILTNTFGGNPLKYKSDEYTTKEVIEAAVRNARGAIEKAGKSNNSIPNLANDRAIEIANSIVEHQGDDARNCQSNTVYIALDVGPTGQFIEPYGDLTEEDVYESYEEMITYGVEAGVDLIHFETFMDIRELEIAIKAAKEVCDLPLLATVSFMESGMLLMGGSGKEVAKHLQEIGVDALGSNCGLGPKEMRPILREMREHTGLPIIMKPNAGLPVMMDGKPCYNVSPDKFAQAMKELVGEGAMMIGGCCGTTPEHIREMVRLMTS